MGTLELAKYLYAAHRIILHMYGLLTDDPTIATDSITEKAYYMTDRVSGQRSPPVENAINSVACWGDTAAVESQPERAAVSRTGERALPSTPGHHWGTICPTDPDYRSELLDRLEAVGAVGDVRLTTLGFPGESHCHCPRCTRQFERSPHRTRAEWRQSVITNFVGEAEDRIDGRVVATLYPDPYPGRLRERAGLDLVALDEYVDEFLVPLCAQRYETTYWVEALARGFADRIADLDATLSVQLAADGVDTERLVTITRQLDQLVDTVVFGIPDGTVDTLETVLERVDGDEPQISAV